MAVTYESLMNMQFPPVEYHYTQKDTMLYALGLGLGLNHTDRQELQFVYEKHLRALPTMGVVLGNLALGPNVPGTGLDGEKILHGEQGLTIHRPLPVAGSLEVRQRITEVIDKGADKGSIIYTESEARDKLTKQVIFVCTSSSFCRGDGGIGGPSGPTPKRHEIPDRKPDASDTRPTTPQQALLYRLSGDYNRVHADVDVAAYAGFDRPILQGLCTFGVAGYSVLRTCAGNEPDRLRHIQVRFSAPVLPGDTLRTDMWQDGNVISFRTTAVERDAVVIDNGRAELTD